MFSHLIVPLDGGPESNVALTQACVMARISGARVTLLRVYSGMTGQVITSLPPGGQSLGFLDGCGIGDYNGNPNATAWLERRLRSR